jgi:RNA polymerase sigma-70 factor (subfamily 1)
VGFSWAGENGLRASGGFAAGSLFMIDDSAETKQLLEHADRDDPAVLDKLFARHTPQLLRFIELNFDARLRARFDPADLVQETQFEAFQRWADYLKRRPMPFRTWLRKNAYDRLCNLRRDHVGAAKRSVMREQQLPDRSSILLAGRLSGRTNSPSTQLARRELSQRVARAVQRLPQAERELLVWRYVEGLAHQEIAYLLQITPAAARKRYGRALLRLERLLLEDGIDGVPS